MSTHNKQMAAIHVAAKAQGLEGDSYRDMLENITGKRSAKDLTYAQIGKVLDHLNGRTESPAGSRPANDPQAAKVAALWGSLAMLGVVDGRLRSLDAWCERTAKVSALRFATPAQKNVLIEGLKDWCRREGFAVPDTKPGRGDGGLAAKQELVGALWDKLGRVGALHITDRNGLFNWLNGRHMSHYGALINLNAAQAEAASVELAAWLAKELARVKNGAPSNGGAP